MAVRILWGKRKSQRNGYSLHEYNGPGYRDTGSDDEDDVFVDDTSLEGLSTASKPLMHPRQRTRVKSRRPDCRCGAVCKPVLYFLLMVIVLGGLLSLLLYVLNRHKGADQDFLSGKAVVLSSGLDDELLVGCDNVEVEDVWVVGFPKLLTESAFRLVDVNQDGVLDVILGFATGVDGYSIPPIVCDIYFNGTYPCHGGLLALEGATGRELWRHYTQHELFAVTCNVDFDNDGVLDCLGAGRAGAMQAISGRSGTMLWDFVPQEAKIEIMGVYTPQMVPDLDGDHVPDVIVAHGGDPLQDPGSPYRLSGRLLVMSGRTGRVLRWVGVPDNKETYYSPQVYLQSDGTPMVLFGTGGETHGGSLWVISVDHLLKGQIMKARALYTDTFKGVMTPPVLLDLTGDGVRDIIISPFNSTVVAIDGASYEIIWNITFPQSETYSTPAPGFYNDDDIPDFMVNFAYGPGFPVYYHAQTTVLDGRTGQQLLDHPIQMSVGAQASPLTVSMEGKGHDLFLYWLADCLQHEGEGGEYHFLKGTNVHEKSRSDFCRLRFKTKGFTRILAFGRNIKAPGVAIYNSEDRKRQERQDWVNTTAEALDFLQRHPEHLPQFPYNDPLTVEGSSPYDLPPGLADSIFPGSDSSVNQGFPSVNQGFPSVNQEYSYGLNQPNDYSKYYPQTDARDRYGSDDTAYSNRGYGNRFKPYGNYFQKRNFLDADGNENDEERNPDVLAGWRNSEKQKVAPSFADTPRETAVGWEEDDQAKNRKLGHAQHHRMQGQPRNTGLPSGNSFSLRRKTQEGAGSYGNFRERAASSEAVQDNSRGHLTNEVNQATDHLTSRISHGYDDSEGQRGEIFGTRLDKGKKTAINDPYKPDFSSFRGSSPDFSRTPGVGDFSENEVEQAPSSGQLKTPTNRKSLAKAKFMKRRRRRRRHVGPHDDDGLQRLLSTGTVAPSSLPADHPDFPHSVDVIFATYWFFPAKTQAILPQDQSCIADAMEKETQRFDPNNPYYGMDHDAYEHSITEECLKKSNHQLSDIGTYESQLYWVSYIVSDCRLVFTAFTCN
ncbi:hypothetical protein C0Q70_12757 [Pomacea canaliculata]|uniref:FAM234A/B beta-propeller domain-containing protein n=1 Tax=Pomacea canaliculata TaxID=400727 RepID=A0A2T7P2H8_POMCA|nr:hypothetical protein C0Q70_12757 [Pomacea canaliculata]